MKPSISRLFSLSVRTLLTLVSIFTFSTTFVVAQDRSFGDVDILATVPFPPGFPEGIAVNGDKVYVAGPASFDTAGTPASKVFEYDMKPGSYYTPMRFKAN
jgi:hypothetical protein